MAAFGRPVSQLFQVRLVPGNRKLQPTMTLYSSFGKTIEKANLRFITNSVPTMVLPGQRQSQLLDLLPATMR